MGRKYTPLCRGVYKVVPLVVDWSTNPYFLVLAEICSKMRIIAFVLRI